MKKFFTIIVLAVFGAPFIFAQNWQPSLSPALNLSKKENKCVFLVFSSGRTPRESNFLQSKDFKDFSKNMVLVCLNVKYDIRSKVYIPRSSEKKQLEKIGIYEISPYSQYLISPDGSNFKRVYISSSDVKNSLGTVKGYCYSMTGEDYSKAKSGNSLEKIPSNWSVDFEKSIENAEKKGTCVYLIATDKESLNSSTFFKTKAFKDYASKNLELVFLEIKKDGNMLVPAEAKNEGILKKYGLVGEFRLDRIINILLSRLKNPVIIYPQKNISIRQYNVESMTYIKKIVENLKEGRILSTSFHFGLSYANDWERLKKDAIKDGKKILIKNSLWSFSLNRYIEACFQKYKIFAVEQYAYFDGKEELEKIEPIASSKGFYSIYDPQTEELQKFSKYDDFKAYIEAD